MLVGMEPVDLAKLAREAEAKLAKAAVLTAQEHLALLAFLMAHQDTRRERRYGQA